MGELCHRGSRGKAAALLPPERGMCQMAAACRPRACLLTPAWRAAPCRLQLLLPPSMATGWAGCCWVSASVAACGMAEWPRRRRPSPAGQAVTKAAACLRACFRRRTVSNYRRAAQWPAQLLAGQLQAGLLRPAPPPAHPSVEPPLTRLPLPALPRPLPCPQLPPASSPPPATASSAPARC